MSEAAEHSSASAEAVAAFLRANPSWLAENPELYLLLTPPARVYGDCLADHMAEMIRAARAHAASAAEQAHWILAAGRAAAALAARVHEAVLALMRSSDPAECISSELPALLAVDAAAMASEIGHARMRPLAPGTVSALLGGRDVVFRDQPPDAALLHAEAAPLAKHDALVRVPLAQGPAVLALAARDRDTLEPGHGAGALAFLGRAIAASYER